MKELIPVQQILQTYMSAGAEDYIEGEDADMQHDEIDEVDEYDQNGLEGQPQSQLDDGIPPMGEEEMPQAGGVMDDTQEPQGEPMEHEIEEPSTPFQNEFRTITSKPKRELKNLAIKYGRVPQRARFGCNNSRRINRHVRTRQSPS